MIGELETFSGLKSHESVDEIIRKEMMGDRANARGDKLHDFTRNSKEMVGAWRAKIDPNDEQVIKDIVLETFAELYSDW